jgi:PST family polysaccharide transporter
VSRGSLTERAVNGIAWQFFAVGGNFILRGLILILLTRSLSARDFGIMAAAAVIVSVTERVGLISVNRVLIQRQELNDILIRSAFAITFWAGCLMMAVVYFFAEVIAVWMHTSELAPIARFLSMTLLLGSVASIPTALMERELRFKALGLAEIGSYFIGFGLIALPMANYGYGVWSLAIGMMVQMVFRAASLFALRPHPFSLLPRREVLGELVRSGLGFSLGQAGNFVATQVDNLIVGRILGAEALGYYNRAYQFLMLPALMFGKALSSVLFPTMASIQHDVRRVRRAYIRAMGTIALLTLPTSGALIIIAPELVRVLLGESWTGMIPPFQILIASLLFRTSYKISDAVSLAMGSMPARALRQWIYAGLVAAGAIIGSDWGLSGVAAGVGLAVLANFLMMLQLAQELLELSWMKILTVHLQQLFNSVLICLPVWLAVHLARGAGLSDLLVLVVGGLVGLAVVSVIWFGFRWLLGDIGEWLHKIMSERIERWRNKSAMP